MKKFSKICLIIVAVLGGMGLLLGGISALLGGGFGAVRRMAQAGEFDAGNWHIRPYGVYYSSDEDTEDERWSDSGTGSGWTDGAVYTYEAAGIKNLDVDIDAAEIYVKQGTDADNLVVTTYNCKEKYYTADKKNNTLQIQYNLQNQIPVNSSATIVIEIPEGMTFNTMDFAIGAADADFASGSVNCRTLNLKVGAGELTGEDFIVKETMEVKLGAGDVELSGGTYKDVKMDCGIGSFDLDDITAENVKAHCGMGDGTITMLGNEEDYNYKMSCGMGDLMVNGESYADLSGSYKVTNPGAIGTIDLDCGMGSIDFDIE